MYNRIIENPDIDIFPRTFIFSGKAAPGYDTAKLLIRLIHAIADAVNGNPLVNGKLNVVFMPDYRVSLAQQIIPAADVSEQISLAGTEASGTGNMKLMLNGALTIGTMDGANVEIHLDDQEIRRVVDSLSNDTFSILQPGAFQPLADKLIKYGDQYMQLADFRSYVDTQAKIDKEFRDTRKWTRKSLVNIARSGKFSSDRTIKEYCSKIWNISK